MHFSSIRRHALLIGISTYEDSGLSYLPGVVADITMLEKQLLDKSSVFDEVTAIKGEAGILKGQQFRETVELFLKTPAEPAMSRLNFLYIGCHADVDLLGVLHLLPSDFSPLAKAATSVPISFVGSCLPYNPAASAIIVLDCCFAGAGAWEMFGRQPLQFQIPAEKEPAYCLIASTRSNEPAVDGAFVPFLVEALNRVEPPPGACSGVGIEAIFDYLAARLVAKHYQVPRIWITRSLAIPIGKTTRGMRLSIESVKEILEATPGRVLSFPGENGERGIDLVEEQVNPMGHRTRTGFRLLETGQSQVAIHQAVESLSASVRARVIDKGAVLVEDETETIESPDRDVLILSFQGFRRVMLPYVRFLEDEIRAYEEEQDGIFQRDCYIQLKAREQGEEVRFALDEYIFDWLHARTAPTVLAILGEFGVGKTTTARRVFWRQAQAHLQSAMEARLPIFVSLREIEKLFDSDALVEWIVRRQDESGRLTARRIRELNKTGKIVWILDGFDEMASRVTDRVLKNNFAQILKLASPESRLLLTCRTAYFKNPAELDKALQGRDLYIQLRTESEERFQVVYVDPLGAEDIERYFRSRNRENVEASLAVLKSNQQIAALASRPLLLEMLVESLPSLLQEGLVPNYSNVYRTYTRRLLERDEWRDTIETPEDRLRFCRELAWHLLKRDCYEVKYSELPDFIKQLFPELAREAEEFSALERSIRTTSFLARNETSGSFSFAHKSFMEFFAADYLVECLRKRSGQELGRMVLPLEIVRFIGQSLDPPIRSYLRELNSPAGFSIAYFSEHYLPDRIGALKSFFFFRVSGRPIKEAAHFGLIFLVIATFPLQLSLAFDNRIPTQVSGFYGGALPGLLLVASVLTLILYLLSHLVNYTARALLKKERYPIPRFNILAILANAEEPVNDRIPDPDLDDLLSDLHGHQRTTAMQVIDGIYSSTPAATSIQSKEQTLPTG